LSLICTVTASYTVFVKESYHCTKHNRQYILLNEFSISEILTAKASLQPPVGAAVRWAVNADGEGGLALLLQALPATAASLNSRPTFKRDICPGVALLNIPLNVDIDYNPGIIGPRPRLFSTNPDTTDKILRGKNSSSHNTAKGNKNYFLINIHHQ